MVFDRKLLLELGIICDSQMEKISLLEKGVHISDMSFDFIPYDGYFLLKNKGEMYLYISSDSILEFVKRQDDSVFYQNASFIILRDELCCSIIPAHYDNKIVTFSDNKLLLKKIITLHIESQTIFKIKKNIKIPIKRLKKKIITPNKNLVKINQLYDKLGSNIDYLTIITYDIQDVPSKLRSLCYSINLLNSSVLFLDYIVNNYNNLKPYSLFINKFSKCNENNNLEKLIYSKLNSQIRTQLDSELTIDGKRKRSFHNEKKGKWKTTNYRNYNLFIKKFIGTLPRDKYFYFSSNNFYLVPRKNICKNKIDFYKKLQYTINKNILLPDILDSFWFTIFTL